MYEMEWRATREGCAMRAHWLAELVVKLGDHEDHEGGGAHRDSGLRVSSAVIEAGPYTRPLFSST